MKSVVRIMSVAGLVLGLALAGLPASAQQPAAPPLKPASQGREGSLKLRTKTAPGCSGPEGRAAGDHR